uniref:uncharacterized protein LOC100186022 isoform X2 n=1 Tax=Ciona intestinalis TaxID=7719 RepID=UPI00089DC9CB|nr:uncharacterized protein LOC100186022 isoform X2 [Ciona intestinalis]|eukprot:XP_026695273.1 uncharacterized protein LOC100186022 isoform X2 [Ciona intestinalis]
MKKHQTMDSPSRLPFEELHKQAKRTANEELASNLPKAPIGLVNSTKEKFNKRIQEICEEYRTAYKNPEVMKDGLFKKNEGVLQGCVKHVSNKLNKQLLKDFGDKINVVLEKKFNDFRNRNAKYEEELLENAMGKILESVTIYKNMVGEATGNSFISETDFERIHQQSKAAALECLEKSSIRNKENFANTLNTAIKQEHEKALERLVTPNTVAKQQAIKPKHSFKFGEIIVQVANCGITDLPKSNIIVNSVGSDFILARGQVSRILLHHVGPKLQTECKNNPKFATESYRITFGKE